MLTVCQFLGRTCSTKVMFGHLLGLGCFLKLGQNSFAIPVGRGIHLQHLTNHKTINSNLSIKTPSQTATTYQHILKQTDQLQVHCINFHFCLYTHLEAKFLC